MLHSWKNFIISMSLYLDPSNWFLLVKPWSFDACSVIKAVLIVILKKLCVCSVSIEINTVDLRRVCQLWHVCETGEVLDNLKKFNFTVSVLWVLLNYVMSKPQTIFICVKTLKRILWYMCLWFRCIISMWQFVVLQELSNFITIFANHENCI